MKSLINLREQVVRKPLGRLALGPQHRFFASQMGYLTPAEHLRLPSVDALPIQNSDGTFLFLVGYDSLGDVLSGAVTI